MSAEQSLMPPHHEAEDHCGEETANETLPGLLWGELQENQEKKERWNHIRAVISHQHIHKVEDTIILYIKQPTYLDQRSSSKEEPKQIGHDVVTDHNRDWDNEPETRGFQENDQQEHIQQGLQESLMKNRSNVGG